VFVWFEAATYKKEYMEMSKKQQVEQQFTIFTPQLHLECVI
jgi:hypothetical protein